MTGTHERDVPDISTLLTQKSTRFEYKISIPYVK